ncbi:MAG: hypothetical protein JWQ62_2600 [Lacunisphaera sp.]|nr:hypothetical protein [Lacunisphaera sp.]
MFHSCRRPPWSRGLLLLALLAGTASAAQTYRGFTIDESAVRKLPNLEAVLAATREQIDMVHDVGLSPDILTFVEGVTFKLVPAGTFKGQTPGIYAGHRDSSVQVSTAIVATGHKPVLLHELMHAYHDQRLERGFANLDILAFYQSAQAIPSYAAKSHMMSNEKEFFACGATAYLFGVTAQEPFRREKIRESQPDYYNYLKKLFGPDAGNHAGSLTR